MNDDTPAKKKLIAYLKKQHPEVEDKYVNPLLNDIKRFVTVVQKIYTESQAQIQYKEKVKKGVKTKNKIITTDIHELTKVLDKSKKAIPVEEVFMRFYKSIEKDKHGR